MKRPTRLHRRRPLSLRLTSLEDRCTPVVISGTPGPDQMGVVYQQYVDSNGVLVRQLHVTVNGAMSSTDLWADRSVVIQAGEGGDSVSVSWTLSGGPTPTFSLIVDGEAGDDVIHLDGGVGRLTTGMSVARGGPGNDHLFDGPGNDSLEGGPGNDTYTFSTFGDTEGPQLDRVAEAPEFTFNPATRGRADSSIDSLQFLGSSAVKVDLSGRTAVLAVGGGRTVQGRGAGPQLERVTTGAGDDTVVGNARDNLFFLGDGNDSATGGTGRDQLIGDLGADTLTGGDGQDFLVGGEGNDHLRGGRDNDTLWGHAGDDTLDGEAGSDVYGFFTTTAPETDTVIESRDVSTDKFTRRSGDWSRDMFWFLLPADDPVTVDLSGASPTIATHTNRTVLALGSANAAYLEDVLGGAGNDRITGNASGNRVFAQAGDDTVVGGGGDDILDGGAGDDRLEGGGGDDAYFFANPQDGFETDTVVELENEGTDSLSFTLPESVSLTLDLSAESTGLGSHTGRSIRVGTAGQAAHLENVRGGDGKDMLTGNAADNILDGGRGDDTYVFKPAGSRTETDSIGEFQGISGGGDGSDTLDFSALPAEAAVRADLAGTDVRTGRTKKVKLAEHPGRTVFSLYNAPVVENVIGGAGDDTMYGNDEKNRLDGGPGNDVLLGRKEADTLFGGKGADRFLEQNLLRDGSVPDAEDYKAEDARFNFQDGAGPGLAWLDEQIRTVDDALARLHGETNNANLLRHPTAQPALGITFLRVATLLHCKKPIPGWAENQVAKSGTILIANTGINRSALEVQKTIVHEMGHNWHDYDINGRLVDWFRALSEWGYWEMGTAPPDGGIGPTRYYLTGGAVFDDDCRKIGYYVYKRGTAFARPKYGNKNEFEDLATTFEWYFFPTATPATKGFAGSKKVQKIEELISAQRDPEPSRMPTSGYL